MAPDTASAVHDGTLRIDAHQHYWSLSHADYVWLQPSDALRPIYRDFGVADLHPLLDAAGIDGTVLVQAAPAEAETMRLLALAARPGSRVLGVVGWTDLQAADAPQRVAALAADPLLKGLRPMLQDAPDIAWVLTAACRPAFEAMAHAGLALDLLIKPHQMETALALARAYPQLRMVIDHGAKPAIAAGDTRCWEAAMVRFARESHVLCKLSGLWTEAQPGAPAEAAQACAEHLLAAFGTQRLMWGSDWPVLVLAGDYAQWHAACLRWLAHLDAAQQAAIFGGNAARFYRLLANR